MPMAQPFESKIGFALNFVPRLRRSFIRHYYPGLTAGPIDSRLFEPGFGLRDQSSGRNGQGFVRSMKLPRPAMLSIWRSGRNGRQAGMGRELPMSAEGATR